MTLSVDVTELLQRTVNSRSADIMTGIPAMVKEYFPGADPTADLIPVVRRMVPTDDEESIAEDLPVVPNVPIMFPRGGKGAYAITWPLEPGDHVWIVVSIFAFSQWRNSGQVSDPGDQRLHSLGSCYAIPGVSPKAEGLNQSTIMALVLNGPEIRIGKGATDYAALASKVEKNHDDILAALSTAKDSTNAPLTFGSPYSKTPVKAAITKVE